MDVSRKSLEEKASSRGPSEGEHIRLGPGRGVGPPQPLRLGSLVIADALFMGKFIDMDGLKSFSFRCALVVGLTE